jgi:WD40 repeat protein
MKSVRVFVSSTFLDMHAERDQLGRVVFNELRSHCARRGADFVGVDLRWGLEPNDRGALDACLKEIDRCRPFFVSLLGDRYGWLPPPERIPFDVMERARDRTDPRSPDSALLDAYSIDETLETPIYGLRRDRVFTQDHIARLAAFWESAGFEDAGLSITEGEILHGALSGNAAPGYAFFYLRRLDLKSTPGFPDALRPVFIEQDPQRRQRLERLKLRIQAAQPPDAVVRTYDAKYEGLRIDPDVLPSLVSSDELAYLNTALRDGVLQVDEMLRLSAASQARMQSAGVVALSGIEELGQRMLADLSAAIDSYLGAVAIAVDTHTEARRTHYRFIDRATQTFIGRDELVAQVFDYIKDVDERRPLVVTGASGAGKSTLLAECARRCAEEIGGALVLPLFIGAAPGSTSLATTLRSLCETLRREAAIDDEVAADPEDLPVQLRSFLAKAGATRTVVLFLDALNQLDPAHRSHALNWLPFYVPRGARLIVSTLEGDCHEALRNRQLIPDRELAVPSLTSNERRELVRTQLALRSKQLTDEQLACLVDDGEKKDAGLPLYLQVAVEELSLCRDRSSVGRRVANLPQTVPELFAEVLQRLEYDHGEDVTERTLSRIAVSRSGLFESEVMDVLSAGGATFSKERWMRLYRALEFYLRPMDETNRSGLIDFYHDQLRTAVFHRYLRMASPSSAESAECRGAHRDLAVYFTAAAAGTTDDHCRWRAEQPHSLSELPFHLVHAGLRSEARALLLDFEWLQTKLQALGPAAVLADFAMFDDDEVLRSIDGTLRRMAVTLEKDHTQLAGQLLARLSSYSAPEIQTLLAQAARWNGDAWLRPLTASLARPDAPRTDRFIGVQAVAVSPDLRQALTCSDEGIVKVWDFETSAEIRTLGRYSHVRSASAATPYGHRAISGTADGSMIVWAPFERMEPVWVLRGHTAPITALAITPDGRVAMSASEDQSLRLWDVEDGTQMPRFAREILSANRLAITPDGRRGLSSFGGSIRFWDIAQGVELRPPFEHGQPIKALAISVDGTRAVFASGNTLHVLDIEGGSDTELSGHDGVIRTLAATVDGVVVSGSDDIRLRVWDVNRCVEIRTLDEHWWSVTCAAATADGRYAISAAGDEMIKIWDLHPSDNESFEKKALTAPSSWINSVVAMHDGRHVLAASRDRSVTVWDSASGTLVRRLTGHTGWVNAIAITPDGKRALTGADDCTVRVWDLSDGTMINTLEGFTSGASALAVSPDGRRAAASCWNSTLQVWDLATYDKVHDLPGHSNSGGRPWIRSVGITPDSTRVVTASQDGTLKVWDLETGRELRSLVGHSHWVMGVAIFPDGRHALSGSADGTLKIWDLETGADLQTLHGHQAFVTSVALFPGARLAASTSEDGTLRVWDLASGRTVMAFTGDGELRTCAVTPDGTTVVAGEDSGRIHFLRCS